jgi:hypothetical protein
MDSRRIVLRHWLRLGAWVPASAFGSGCVDALPSFGSAGRIASLTSRRWRRRGSRLINFELFTGAAIPITLCRKMKPSPESDQPICNSCSKRPATNYICYGGTGKSAELCDDCINTEDPTSAAFTSEAKSAKCVYCGGFPCCGGTDSLSQITGRPPTNRWMCMSCSAEYYSFMQGAVSGIGAGLTQEEQINLLKEVGTKIEAHMIAFVSRRDN